MISKLAAAATAATLTFGAAAPAAAMDQELNMLMGAIYFEVKSLGLDPTNIDQLTVNQLARIKAITSSSNDDQGAKFQVKKILDEAGGS